MAYMYSCSISLSKFYWNIMFRWRSKQLGIHLLTHYKQVQHENTKITCAMHMLYINVLLSKLLLFTLFSMKLKIGDFKNLTDWVKYLWQIVCYECIPADEYNLGQHRFILHQPMITIWWYNTFTFSRLAGWEFFVLFELSDQLCCGCALRRSSVTCTSIYRSTRHTWTSSI